eukprot:6447293-Amphidinium_carterae.1
MADPPDQDVRLTGSLRWKVAPWDVFRIWIGVLPIATAPGFALRDSDSPETAVGLHLVGHVTRWV